MGRPRKPVDATTLEGRFALRLRKLMDRNGWPSADVADRLTAAGVTITAGGVNFWLRGEGMPQSKDLERIGQALGYRDYRDLLPPPIRPQR